MILFISGIHTRHLQGRCCVEIAAYVKMLKAIKIELKITFRKSISCHNMCNTSTTIDET